VDTTAFAKQKPERQERQRGFTRSKAFGIAGIGSALILGSIALQHESVHIRSLRNDYLPNFHNTYDNYTQYAPAAALVIMKAAGVQSRSSWGRMLVSDAFSVGLMVTAVNVMKTVIHVKRPDGSSNNSYPSGHTATAFMTATMFSKEYGPRSKWYSIGAYTVATATGLTRMLNNRHWFTDGMCGAGIGIITTELGYYFADLLFKEKGLNFKPVEEKYYMNYKPSFVGFSAGFNYIPGTYHTPTGEEITFDTGAEAGFEGAWFITRNIGIGGRLAAANVSVNYNGKDMPTADATPEDKEFGDSFLDVISAQAGGYFSLSLTPRWSVGSKLLAGISYSPKNDLAPFVEGRQGVFSMSTGASITYRCKQYLGLKVFVNYNGQKSSLVLQDKLMHLVTLGGTAQILL
ncbi:MAG: phosphatase PAP2 family protein, partial [Bacteroidales bacterium]